MLIKSELKQKQKLGTSLLQVMDELSNELTPWH